MTTPVKGVEAGKREACIFCGRDLATDEDWNHPAMEKDEPHVELDALCWDPGDPAGTCLMVAEEQGRPTDYEGACEQLAKAHALFGRIFDAEHHWRAGFPPSVAAEIGRAYSDLISLHDAQLQKDTKDKEGTDA